MPLDLDIQLPRLLGFPCGSPGKESACNAQDLGLICVLGGSPGEGNGNPLQNACLESPMGRIPITWLATVYGIVKNQM